MSLIAFTFNNTQLVTVTINGKYWTRAREPVKAMYEKKTKTGHIIRELCSAENIRYKYELVGVLSNSTPVKWPSDSQKYDLYINEKAMYEFVFKSEQKLAKEFQNYCFNTMFPQLRQKLTDIAIEDIKKGHQVAIENIGRQHQLAIEERDNHHHLEIQGLQYENVGLQGEVRACERNIERLQQRYVNERGNIDNTLIAIEKNKPDEEGKPGRHPYAIIRCQKQNQGTQIYRKNRKYPDMIIKGTCDDANAVHKMNSKTNTIFGCDLLLLFYISFIGYMKTIFFFSTYDSKFKNLLFFM